MNDQFLTELQNVMGGSGIFMEEPMKKHTTFRVGGAGRCAGPAG